MTVKKVPAATATAYADYLEGKTVGSELGGYYLKDGKRVTAGAGLSIYGISNGRSL